MRRISVGKIITYVILVVSSLVLLYPLLFMFLGSNVTINQYYLTKVIPIPDRFDLYEFQKVIEAGLLPNAGLTLLRVAWYLFLALSISLFGGYVFSRLEFPGKNFAFMFLLSGIMIPGILISLPTYIIVARLPLAGGNNILGIGGHGFVNEWPALFIVGMVDVLALFLMKQNYDMLPAEYEEAAIMDGAGLFTIIFRVYAPLLRAPLTAVVVMVFIAIWNDYWYPFLFVAGNEDLSPIALAVQRWIYRTEVGGVAGRIPYPTVFAAATLTSLVPLVVYLGLQKYFVQGLVGVGLKG
jgi:multiple sugar transport system permease protein